MNDYDRADYGRTAQRSLTGWLLLVGVFFVAGMLTMGWVLTRWDAAAPYLSWMRPAPAEPAARPAGLMTSEPAMPADVERRVNDLEDRIDRISEVVETRQRFQRTSEPDAAALVASALHDGRIMPSAWRPA